MNEAERKVRAIRGRLLSFLRAPRGAGDAQSHRYIEDGIVLAKSLTAHAGEEGPAAYVWEALDALGVARIDHGNHSLDDAALVGRLARERRSPICACGSCVRGIGRPSSMAAWVG